MVSVEEIWVPIAGDWRREYQVSSIGRCRSVDDFRPPRGRPFPPQIYKLKRDIHGYNRVKLSDSSSAAASYKVSRLVADAFIFNDDPTSKIQVDHLDNDRSNDRIDNLEWVTEAEQQRRRAARMRAIGKTTSQFIGVTWHDSDQRWCAQIVVEKKRKFLGNFRDEVEAARTYNAFVREHGLDHPINPLEAS
jgi:hypothetical protein